MANGRRSVFEQDQQALQQGLANSMAGRGQRGSLAIPGNNQGTFSAFSDAIPSGRLAQTGGGFQLNQQQFKPQIGPGKQDPNQITTQVQPQMSRGLIIDDSGNDSVPFLPPGGGFPRDIDPRDPLTGELDPSKLFDISLGKGGFAGFDPKKFAGAIGEGFERGQAPEFQTFDLDRLAKARRQFAEVFRGGARESIRNFDRAQNRLRERTRQGADIARQQAIEQSLGSGRGAFQGAIQQQLGGIEAGRLGALAEGQVGLEREFEDARLRGLETALGAAQGRTGLEQGLNQLGLQQSLAGNQFLRDIFQGQEDLRQREAADIRDTRTERGLGGIKAITERGAIRAGLLPALLEALG